MTIEEMFCSAVVRECRSKVRNSPLDKVDPDEVRFRGYIYESDGRYQLYWLPKDMENLAKFICSDPKDKLLCSSEDYAILNTNGNMIDLCVPDKEFLDNLKKILIPIQKSNRRITAFKSLD